MDSTPLLTASVLPTGGALVVGLSGGLDSVVLLHALAALPEVRQRGLRAVHVHHGLHADADAWQRYCEHACAQLQVALQSVRVAVVAAGEGLEAAARHARHAVFADALAADEVLVLAHHRDDQAETFLLRALRGSGVDGLGAMRPWRRFAHGWLWRPLLDRRRDELHAYANAHGLQWVEDPSNADARFDRNFLRAQLLPLLRERWPHAEAGLAAAADLCAQADTLLAAEDARCLAMARTADAHVLARDALCALPAERRARVLRLWIRELALPPLPAEGIARIEAEILPARADAEPRFRWQRAEIRAWRDLLHAGQAQQPLAADWRQPWDGTTPLALPDGSRLSLSGSRGFETAVVVHARQGGERIVLPGRAHSHALKHVLQDLGIPAWVRERLPLLSDAAGELLAAADLAYSAGFDAWLRERGARLHWQRD
ncbi:tRNA lysidine(34) synthetase TilS [Lysobacter solisilvae (ex Woo and Kim 2020)]|uniref:tRNA(Ile)-lysidine synthase n=1 Tax=Agrilutibacter terrestris TaxID=2865112 RepID=A0A7H0FW25_9GAMM|nr:tRNA lysidine(34) synthetase TilS [Lysobacter terrestris]QNP40241.1 tRNA lysidine(34) synthetase TilS [Lysobacter terrestris]